MPIVAVLSIVLLALGGIAVWQLTKDKSTTIVEPSRKDASQVEMGVMLFDPDPEGATGTITDENGNVTSFGPTSHDPKKRTALRVEANRKVKIHIELAGHNPYDTESSVVAGETLRIAPTLEKASAKLHVETTPVGATVTLDGKLLGETPLTLDGFDAKDDAVLVISKVGYETQRIEVKLALGETANVVRELKEQAKMGAVSIVVTGSATWAEVSFKGKKLGRTREMTGLQAFRLPVGKQQLKLLNPANKKTKTISVDVTEAAQTITVSLD
jgi:hypothetical protein